jgi:hypothetical protein
MKRIEDDANLARTLQETITNFSNDFDAKAAEYCNTRADNGKTSMNCSVDYGKFSSEYQQMCQDSEASFNPVTMFMQCSSDSITIEMDIFNTPSCIANSCGNDGESLAMSRALKVVEAQVTGLSCVFFEKSLTSKSADINTTDVAASSHSFQIARVSMILVLALMLIKKRQRNVQ